MQTPSSSVFSVELLASENGLLSSVVRPLERLLNHGCAIIEDKAVCALLQGLAYPCDDGRHWVVSERLLEGVAELGNTAQMVAALLATDSDFRQPWLILVAARCQEAAQLRDSLQLVERINQLGAASEWVERYLSQSSLQPTSYSNLERELFGSPAEQIGSLASLIRVLAKSHQLCLWQQSSLSTLARVTLKDKRPDLDWISGRLLPAPEEEIKYSPYLLHDFSADHPNGGFAQDRFEALPLDAERSRTELVLDWVLNSPWAFLLAAISYEQDIWASEGVAGIQLELPAGQNALKPTLVQVLVLNQYGDEVLCGSLAEFIRRILRELSMTLFPAALSDHQLNQQLSSVIELLSRREVWQRRDGVGNELDTYQITPQFADACYRMKGQRVFALYGKAVRAVIRTQALRWRQEQQLKTNQSVTSARLQKDSYQ